MGKVSQLDGLSDAELIDVILSSKGQEGTLAFDALYFRYEGLVTKVIRREFFSHLNTDVRYTDAYRKDLEQETWISIHTKLNSFDRSGYSSAKSWIWQIAKNKTIDFLKSSYNNYLQNVINQDSDKESTNLDENLTKLIGQSYSDLEGTGMSFEDSILFMDCLERVSERFKMKYLYDYELLATVVHHGLTTTELAEYLQRKPGAARQYLSDVRKKFANFIEPCVSNMDL